MNNVEQLAYLLEEMPVLPMNVPETIRRDYWRMIAESLIRNGVVVASTLEIEDFRRISNAYNVMSASVNEGEYDGIEALEYCRKVVKRIALGDAK